MPKFWDIIAGKSKFQPLSDSGNNLDDRVDEETGRIAAIADAASSSQGAGAAGALLGEPVEDDSALLIPHTPEELQMLRTLGQQRYVGWGKTGVRSGAGQVTKLVAKTVAGTPGLLASQVPALLNAGDTADRARTLQTIANFATDTSDVYGAQAGELKKAIAGLARMLDARASGQFTSAAVSTSSSVATLAAAPVLAVVAVSLAVPPLAIVVVPVAAGTALAFGAERLTRRVVEQWNDVDRNTITDVLLDCAQKEIARNGQAQVAWDEATRAEAAHKDEFHEGLPFVPEPAVQALQSIGVSRDLLVAPSSDTRVRDMIRRYIS